jgi:hypothetical protein
VHHAAADGRTLDLAAVPLVLAAVATPAGRLTPVHIASAITAVVTGLVLRLAGW